MEKELKPFDKILVRNSNKGYWIPALYGFKSKDMKHHLTSAGWQDECIPYEGNEKLLGTQFDYAEKKERKPSFDEAQGTPIISKNTIEEMAEKAYPDFTYIEGESGREKIMSNSNMRNAYKSGAKAVLEEVENIYNSGGVAAVLDRFRELKGDKFVK